MTKIILVEMSICEADFAVQIGTDLIQSFLTDFPTGTVLFPLPKPLLF